MDGDTLRCGSLRLRLLGIDAPELHGCPSYRQCAPGDGKASRSSLSRSLRLGPFSYRVVTWDRFGRAVVIGWAGAVNLSCWQMRQRQAVYVERWDTGRRIARECR